MNQKLHFPFSSCRTSGVLAALVSLALWLGLAAPVEPAEELVLEEDWDALSIDPETWEPWGDPQPVILPSVHGRAGVLDSRGDPSWDSGLQSKALPAMPGGFLIESDVYIEVTDPEGCWMLAFIGISRSMAERDTSGNYVMGIQYILTFEGGACWMTPEPLQRHSYLWFGVDGVETPFWGKPGAFDYNADTYNNGWHTLSVQVDAGGIASFHVDGSVLYTSPEPVDRVVMEEPQSIVVGGRSSGVGGKAYHDTVRVFALSDSPAPTGSGLIYYSCGTDYHSMKPDGTEKTLVLKNLGERSEPSENLHSGARWFLTALPVGGEAETYPDGRPRYEIFALSDGAAKVRLSDDPGLQPFDPEQPVGPADFHGLKSASLRWALDDRRVSWLARRWQKDPGTGNGSVVEAGIYSIDLAGDVSEAPVPATPARVPVEVPLMELNGYGIAPDVLGYDWSPDGKLVVVATSAGLVLHDSSTGQARELAPSGAFPRWSPDGLTVAFDHDGDCGGIDMIVPGEASPVPRTILPPGPAYLRCGALWSPTGSHVAFLSKKKGGSPGAAEGDNVGRATAAGERALVLTRDLGVSARPMGWRGEGQGAPFRRGDADASGLVNITDAIFTLNHLFLGGPAPGCADAADADDDGALQITDAIHLLAGLFLGGPQPPAPGASACGPDPGNDDLQCSSYPPCGDP
jgi:hypothetical protein